MQLPARPIAKNAEKGAVRCPSVALRQISASELYILAFGRSRISRLKLISAKKTEQQRDDGGEKEAVVLARKHRLLFTPQSSHSLRQDYSTDQILGTCDVSLVSISKNIRG